ncbi:AraC family transcriptional regulator [Rhizobium sp. TRM95111]|uniref:AraC family transcriptional regulator n=1 Tax=Rhizobium alarense TaxID=2846851 RepID=UPI001F32386A|nr:AraC family transcriptional regulator [Rhizobium alarense]MCF3640756.1 AraC family transcriptional regulator [Rhizobium alarense]
MLDRNSHNDAVDPVSELLLGMRLRGASYGQLRLAPPFGVRFPAGSEARFHFIAAGTLLLRAADGTLTPLACGDAVLLPRGDEHALVSAAGVPLRGLDSYETTRLCSDVCAIRECAPDTCRTKDTLVFTGRMEFELETLHPLIGLMPAVMSVGALLGRQPEIMPLLEAMEREMAQERAGSAGILARLADVVAATIVRGWVECGCGDATGWIEALRDPRLGRVIAALHRDPGRAWTVAEMASAMGSSRSVFAKRFVDATGTTPQRYVLALRMRLAEQWFRRDKLPIDTAARRLGFSSQAAFTRAFKRVIGYPPGRSRLTPDAGRPAATR